MYVYLLVWQPLLKGDQDGDCMFAVFKVQFLGIIIKEGHVAMNPVKLRAIHK